MSRADLLEKIRGLPLVDQVALAEAVLHELGTRLAKKVPVDRKDREALRQQMVEAAQEAAEYYRTDPEVALWRSLEGEP